MTAEPLGEATYKITLDKEEAADLSHNGTPHEMRSFISGILDRLQKENSIDLPEGRLLAEAFLRSDGSFVFFISPLDIENPPATQRYYACDISGSQQLLGLCQALSPLSVPFSIYRGSSHDRYRLIFTEATRETGRICSEFGDYCEISQLFAAQTAEYLTEISCSCAQDDG